VTTLQKPITLDTLFRALADFTRLRLLNLMGDHEVCVCYFVSILGISQPKISRHLSYLRRAGIVAARRQGRWMHYRLVTPQDVTAAAILKETLAHLRQEPEMEADLEKMTSACCQPVEFALPREVPQPSLVSWDIPERRTDDDV